MEWLLMNQECSRLALGTAQLGMSYGVGNRSGQPSQEEARAIIELAYGAGVRCIDTAQAYGDSEAVVGARLHELGILNAVRVVTKLHPTLSGGSYVRLDEAVQRSLERLRVPSLWGLLLHREDDLDRWTDLRDGLFGPLKESGLVKYVGASVYSEERARQAVACQGLDIIQVPGNALDDTFLRSGLYANAVEAGIRVQIRSVYLQGLLLMDPDDLSPEMSFASGSLSAYQDFCSSHGLEPGEFALKYCMVRYPEATLVVGVESMDQVNDNLRWCRGGLEPFRHLCSIWDQGREPVDETLIRPFNWPTVQRPTPGED